MQYQDNAYNYLAIGNSLTLIQGQGIDRGICSTKPDNDYFGLVVSWLKRQNLVVVAKRFNFCAWERMKRRSGGLELLKPFLDSKLNLVTIQLGENTNDLSTYQEDLVVLVNHIKTNAPKAKIVIVGDFWSKQRNDMRHQAAKDSGCLFADFREIIGKKDFQSRSGIICYKKNGETFRVSDEAASHPGDRGMKYIADRIVDSIK